MCERLCSQRATHIEGGGRRTAGSAPPRGWAAATPSRWTLTPAGDHCARRTGPPRRPDGARVVRAAAPSARRGHVSTACRSPVASPPLLVEGRALACSGGSAMRPSVLSVSYQRGRGLVVVG